MEFNLSKIKFSKNDLKNNVRIPKILTEELAEFVGIMVGDGHIGYYENRNARYPYFHYEVRISGNLKDSAYYSNFISNLASELFNTKFIARKPKNENTVILTKDSKAIYYFLKEYFEIPQRKDNVRIPKIIRNATTEIKSSFLRGLADADFTLTIKIKEGKPYPSIQGSSKSKELINDVSLILHEFNIKNCTLFDKNCSNKGRKPYPGYRIYINGIDRIKIFLSKIGFSNPRHSDKFYKYLKERARRDSNP